jgi:hypothetical protein
MVRSAEERREGCEMKTALKRLLWTTGAFAGMSAASLAHAGGPVYYSVDAAVAPGVNLGVSNVPPPAYYPQPVYVQPAPVLVAPRPVYVVPQPVYVQRPSYVVEYESEGRHGHWDREHEERHRGHDRGEHGHHDRDD